MVIKKKAWLCGKCLSMYKTQQEALRCEINCLDRKTSNQVYSLFLNLYESFIGEKGVIGIKSLRNQLLIKLNKCEDILCRDKTMGEQDGKIKN